VSSIASVFFAIGLGALIAVYMPMNAVLAKHLGSAVSANLVMYGIGFVSTLVMFYAMSAPLKLSALMSAPPYVFLAGILSAGMVLGMIYLLPLMGARQVFVLLVSGQVLMAILVSHLQWFGAPVIIISSSHKWLNRLFFERILHQRIFCIRLRNPSEEFK